MKKNWITIILAILLVISVCISISLAMNSGTLLQQPTPEATVKPTAIPNTTESFSILIGTWESNIERKNFDKLTKKL